MAIFTAHGGTRFWRWVGVGVGVGIIVVGVLLAMGWAAVGVSVLGGAIYGVFNVAQHFIAVKCAVMWLIGGVRVDLGNWLGAVRIAGRTLWVPKARNGVLTGRLMETTPYIHNLQGWPS